MKIPAYNPKLCVLANNLKGKNFKVVVAGLEKLKSQLPNTRLYADCADYSIGYEKRDKLAEEYYKKLLETFFDDLGNLKKEAVEFMEAVRIDVGQNNSKKSIREIIKNSITDKQRLKGTFFHATGYKEIGEKIIKEGFDPVKIARTKYGPGFYFSSSEGGALQYSSCVLKGDLEGNCAFINTPFYEKVTSFETLTKLRKMFGLESCSYGLREAEEKAITQMINEYSRHIIMDEFGCDLAYNSSSVFDTCCVVFNPKAISNLRF